MSVQHVEIHVGDRRVEVAGGAMLGQQLIALAGICPPQQLLLDVEAEIDVPLAPDDLVLIRGGERFVVGDGEPAIEDNPHLREPIRFHLNGRVVPESQRFARAKVTAAAIKALDTTSQPGDQLWADLRSLADEPLRDEQRVVLQRRDRFIVVPSGNVGLVDAVASDAAAVAGEYPGAELVVEGARQYLVVPDFPVDPGYLVPAGHPPSRTTLLIVVPPGYPIAAPDMFWVEPALQLAGGAVPNGAGCTEAMIGRTWQRFSWHYAAGGTAWRPGVSTLLSFVAFCRSRLQRAY